MTVFFVVFQTCRPKELLIGLLEQLEQDEADAIAESVLLLLIPLQKGKDKKQLPFNVFPYMCTVKQDVSILHSCQCCCAWEVVSLRLWA